MISSVTSGTSGSGSPVKARGGRRDQLEQPSPARVDHPGLAELVEHLRRPRESVLAARDDPAERRLDP